MWKQWCLNLVSPFLCTQLVYCSCLTDNSCGSIPTWITCIQFAAIPDPTPRCLYYCSCTVAVTWRIGSRIETGLQYKICLRLSRLWWLVRVSISPLSSPPSPVISVPYMPQATAPPVSAPPPLATPSQSTPAPDRVILTADKVESVKGLRRTMVKTMTLSGQVPQFGYCDEINLNELVQ